MRGVQLGTAIGATVTPLATKVSGFDHVILTKRTPPQTLEALRRRPWIWDLVDFFPQPESNAWDCDKSVAWVRQRIEEAKPSAIIWPTERMREDCDTGLPGLVLPHHHRIGIGSNPIRQKVRKVGYEGSPRYLGKFHPILTEECRKRGWEFVVNPACLTDLDIAVAFRDPTGYASHHWKSHVKLANCHASGTPFVGSAESGYLENRSGAEYWAKDASGIRMSFDWLEDQSGREQISDRFRAMAYPVERAAADLKRFLCELSY